MTLIRKWALALCLVLLSSSYSNAQVDPVTGNLINTGTAPTDTTTTWNNGVYVNTICFQAGQPGNCGPRPSVRAASGDINFSYGQTDLNQIININRALAAGGTGVQLSGFNFGFRAKNGNGWDDGRQDYLDAYVKFYNAGGGLAATYDYVSQTNRKYNWTDFHFSETFSNPVAASNFSNAQVGFIGKDNNFWAGNYGPEINNVSFSLKYRTDPCVTNPAYAPNCAGFKDVITTGNLIPNPNAWGQSMTQAYAVNTALQNAGIGAMVHGINYSFDWHVGDSQCTSTILWIFCDGWTNSNVNVNVRMTASNGQALLNRNYGFSGENVGGHVDDKYLLPTSLNQTALANVGMSASGWGDSAAGNFRSSLIYTADPCAKDPLYSSSCTGYAAALVQKMTASNSTSTTSSSTGAVTVTATAADTTTTSTPSTNVGGVQMSSTGTISAPDNIPQALKDVQAATQQSLASTPTATQTTQQQSGKPGVNMNLVMSLIGQIQAADRATQAAAVQNANQVAATSSAKAQEQANQMVESLNAMSAASSQSSQLFAANTTAASFAAAAAPQQLALSVAPVTAPAAASLQTLMMSSTQSATAGQAPVAQSAPVTYSAITSQTFEPVQLFQDLGTVNSPFSMASAYAAAKANSAMPTTPAPAADTASAPVFASVPIARVDTSLPDSGVLAPAVSAARATSVTEMAEVRANLETAQNEKPAETVKKNVQANELAGGVDIASIATQPRGFDVYSITVIKDGAFYAPKDIYGNQKTIDNARALRSLSSDRLHQDMVDQQYRR